METSTFTNRTIHESFLSIFFKRHCLQLRFVTFPELLVMQPVSLYTFGPSARSCFDSSKVMISLRLCQMPNCTRSMVQDQSIEHLCLPPSGTSRFSCCAGGIGGMGASAPIESSVERSCAWRTQLDKVWGGDFGRIQFGASWHNF